jgi:hypothetical protein
MLGLIMSCEILLSLISSAETQLLLKTAAVGEVAVVGCYYIDSFVFKDGIILGLGLSIS